MLRLILVGLIAGCAPVIQSSTPDGISIQYEAPGLSVADTETTAARACAAYGKSAKLVSDVHAVPSQKVSENFGLRTAYYECVAPE